MDVGVEQLVPVPDTLDSSVVDTNGNNSDNTPTAGSDNSQDHDNMEDNINEAASEDSGMSSVDNHNMSGQQYEDRLDSVCVSTSGRQVPMFAFCHY